MKNTAKDLVIRSLKQLAFDKADLNIRYKYVESDRMHLIEIDPPVFYGLRETELIENQLSNKVSDIDLTQVVLFVTKDDNDFWIEEPDFEIQASGPNVLVSVDYTNDLGYSVIDNIIKNNEGLRAKESNFALAA